MKLGVIGLGNMGGAITTALIKNKIFIPSDINIFDKDMDKTGSFKALYKDIFVTDAPGAITGSDFILIAVKPQDMDKLISSNAGLFDDGVKTIISIAAGVKTPALRKYIKKAPIARVMPNLAAMTGNGASGVYFDGSISNENKDMVLKMLNACGAAIEVPSEGLLDAVTGLSGSGPAYVFTFISALADAGVMEGLPRETAKALAVQTVAGSALYAASELKKGIHIEELKDRVMSPGGTTARGVYALEEGKFRASIINAVKEASAKSRELGEK